MFTFVFLKEILSVFGHNIEIPIDGKNTNSYFSLKATDLKIMSVRSSFSFTWSHSDEVLPEKYFASLNKKALN
jgi:hypothetical protein